MYSVSSGRHLNTFSDTVLLTLSNKFSFGEIEFVSVRVLLVISNVYVLGSVKVNSFVRPSIHAQEHWHRFTGFDWLKLSTQLPDDDTTDVRTFASVNQRFKIRTHTRWRSTHVSLHTYVFYNLKRVNLEIMNKLYLEMCVWFG